MAGDGDLDATHPYDAIIDDRVHRGDNMAVSKHKAANAAYCERIIRRLQSNGQHEEADMIVWLLWWRAMDSQTARRVDEMRLEEIAQLREQIDAMELEEREGWCGHCACQSCYDAKRKADHW